MENNKLINLIKKIKQERLDKDIQQFLDDEKIDKMINDIAKWYKYDKEEVKDIILCKIVEYIMGIYQFDILIDDDVLINKIQKDISFIVKKYVYTNCSSKDIPFNNPESQIDVNDIEQFVDSIETNSDLCSSLKKLNKLEAEIICYRFFEEYKEQEIADILGYSQPYIHRILTQAINKLKRHMKNI